MRQYAHVTIPYMLHSLCFCSVPAYVNYIIACVASVSVGFSALEILNARVMGREQNKDETGEGRKGEVSFAPPPLPPRIFVLLPRPISRASENATETLATQANYTLSLR